MNKKTRENKKGGRKKGKEEERLKLFRCAVAS
jgi:hypothetical protein